MREVIDLMIVMPELFWGGAEKQFRFLLEDLYCKEYKILVLNEHAYGASNGTIENDFMRHYPYVFFEEISIYGFNNIKAGMALYKRCISIFKKYKIKNIIIYDVKGIMLLPLMSCFRINAIYAERNEGLWITNKKITNLIISNFANKLTANSIFATEVLKKNFHQHLLQTSIYHLSQLQQKDQNILT